MGFVSAQFYLFLVVLFIIYFALNKIAAKYQWVWLLVCSIAFYYFFNPLFFVSLGFVVLTTYASGLIMGRLKSEKTRFWTATITIIIDIAYLIFTKVGGNIIMPIGISFYTFQSIGYVLDVYREKCEPEKNVFRYALYVSFFPQITQGPIGRYTDLMPQLTAPHEFDYDRFTKGLIRLIIGTFKKIYIANQLGIFVDMVYADPTGYSGASGLIATFLYAFQLYADFSGYMDIILGVSTCLGITLSENFEQPYLSQSVAEYWRRWHITVGAWFRDYFYYPFQMTPFCMKVRKTLKKKGKKKLAGQMPAIMGLIMTWTMIGFWHGITATFILDGFICGVIIAFSTIMADTYEKWKKALHIKDESTVWKAFRVIRTFGIILMRYVLFRSVYMSDAVGIYTGIFTRFITGSTMSEFINDDIKVSYWIFAVIGIGCMVLFDAIEIRTKERVKDFVWERKLPVRWGLLIVMLFAVFLFVNTEAASASNFLYYKF